MSEGLKKDHKFFMGLGLITFFFTRALVRYKNRMPLAGKVVLITGGSRGLGLILARRIAQENATVIICARNGEELDQVKAQMRKLGRTVHSFVCDITDQAEVSQMVRLIKDSFGRIDLLINNAGIIQVGHFPSLNEKDFQEALNVDFWGAVQTTFEVLPEMIQKRQGRIATISSIGGIVPIPHLLPYSSAKFALRAFSEGLSTEASAYGIQVITVNPGLMRTGSFLKAQIIGQSKEERKKEMSWFTLGAVLPFVSMNAERAAKKTLSAIRLGKPTVTLGVPAQVLRLVYSLFPKTTLKLLSVVNRAMTENMNKKNGSLHFHDQINSRDDEGSHSELGEQLASSSSVTQLAEKWMGEEKLRRYNQS